MKKTLKDSVKIVMAVGFIFALLGVAGFIIDTRNYGFSFRVDGWGFIAWEVICLGMIFGPLLTKKSYYFSPQD